MTDPTLVAEPSVDDYLRPWRRQPLDAPADDPRYAKWEASWDALEDAAEAGVPAAVEALVIVDAEVRATIAQLRDDTTPKLCVTPCH